MRVGISSDRAPTRRRCWPRVLEPAEMAGAELAGEVTHGRAVRRAGRRGEAVHRRRARPRHQGHDAADDGRARHRGARAAGDRRRSTTCSRVSPDGVFFSNGPGDPAAADARRSSCCRTCSSAGMPVLRHLLRQPALRPGARASAPTSSSYGHRGINQPVMDRTTGKVEITAHNHGFAVDAPLDAPTADAVRRRRRSATSASTTTSSRASSCATPTATCELLGAVPPGGRGRSARRRLPLRPVRRPDAATASEGRLMPQRAPTSSSVLVIGSGPIVIGQACEFDYSGTQACRVLRGRGPAGHPGQLQPGDDHDRPGVRRRDLRRADHARVRREDHRQGAPRRAAGRPSAARPR